MGYFHVAFQDSKGTFCLVQALGVIFHTLNHEYESGQISHSDKPGEYCQRSSKDPSEFGQRQPDSSDNNSQGNNCLHQNYLDQK